MPTRRDTSFHHKAHPPTQSERIAWATERVVAAARLVTTWPDDVALRTALVARLNELDAVTYAALRAHRIATTNGEQPRRRRQPAGTS